MQPVQDQTTPPRTQARGAEATPNASSTQDDLRMLSAAGTRYGRNAEHPSRTRRPSLLIGLLAGLAIGAVATFAVPFKHHAEARFTLIGPGTREAVTELRTELTRLAWAQTRATDGDKPTLEDVHVHSDGGSSLSLTAITRRTSRALAQLKILAADFVEQTRRRSEARRTTPGPTEVVLAEIDRDLNDSVTEAEAQVDAAIASLPDTDPSEHRQALLAGWQTLRSSLSSARRELADATTTAEQLKTESTTDAAVVDAAKRQRRITADRALQQDLRELAVNLTELKLHLLNVWQASAGPLESLRADARELHAVATGAPPATTLTAVPNPSARAIITALEPYRDGLSVFAERWDKAFIALRLVEVDAMSGEILDVFQHIRRDLSDFLFDAGKRLSTLRSVVRSHGQNPIDNARRHVFHSDLIRAFQTVEAAHHRFEFAAGTIDTPKNFRLDAALTSARGLRRRSSNRLREIEDGLLLEAEERARKRRLAAADRAESTVQRVRSTTDRAVDELVALQEELNLSTGLTEGFLRATFRAEVAATRLGVLRKNLRSITDRLSALGDQRTAGAGVLGVEIVSCTVEPRPFNLGARLQTGGISAVLAFFAVFLGQWWVTRPR